MRVSSLGVARPVYYDRNATTIGKVYEASTVAPHNTTIRWTYTVASGKAAYVEAANGIMWRDGAATAASLTQIIFNVQTSDAATVSVLQNRTYSNTTNSPVTFAASQLAYLKAGDIFFAATYDGSTGGTWTLGAYTKFTQFDA